MQRHPFDIGPQRMPGGIQRFPSRTGLEGKALVLRRDPHRIHAQQETLRVLVEQQLLQELQQ
jgi:hypothetical protein